MGTGWEGSKGEKEEGGGATSRGGGRVGQGGGNKTSRGGVIGTSKGDKGTGGIRGEVVEVGTAGSVRPEVGSG